MYEPAVGIVEAFLKGEKPAQKPMNESVDNVKVTDSSNEECHYCEVSYRLGSFDPMIIPSCLNINDSYLFFADLRKNFRWRPPVECAFERCKASEGFEEEKTVGASGGSYRNEGKEHC